MSEVFEGTHTHDLVLMAECKSKYCGFMMDAGYVGEENNSLRAALDLASEAIDKYGRHSPGCPHTGSRIDLKCSCGFKAALQSIRSARTEK